MQDIIPFDFNGHDVRTLTDDQEQTWFVAADVAKVLEYSRERDMYRLLADDEADAHIVRVRSQNGVEQRREPPPPSRSTPMTNPKLTPEAMGQELARDIEAFANALEAAGVKGPHFDLEEGTASLPLVAILFAHDQRKTHPDQVPTLDEIRQQLVGTLSTRDKEH